MERPPGTPLTDPEPAWHRIDESIMRGRREPVAVAKHLHSTAQADEAVVAIDLMQRMGVDCGEIGYHRHSVAVPSDDLRAVSRNSEQVPHHHHDLRCLFDAGVQSVRPKMIEQERRLERNASQMHDLRRRVDETLADKALAQKALNGARETMTEMIQFMESMPAVGPWNTVYDQYVAWVDEQVAEEQSA